MLKTKFVHFKQVQKNIMLHLFIVQEFIYFAKAKLFFNVKTNC